ncbi:MAG TPA: PAS domain S-box protein [Candidatus Binataceae bacterium]|nr:PAS domain S-box protein [Candidatus Binataceae bacterium]
MTTPASLDDSAFRCLAELSPHGVFRTDPEGRLLFANQRLLKLIRNSSASINNPASWLHCLHPDDHDAIRRTWREVLLEPRAWSRECRLISPDHGVGWLKLSGYPCHSERGNLVGFVGTVEELSRHEPRHSVLNESEELYRSLIDAMPQIVFMSDEAGIGLRVNRKWHEYTGAASDDRHSWRAAIHPDEVEAVVQGWRRAISEGSPYETAFRFRRADGVYRRHLIRAVPIRDESGKVRRWIGTATDIDVHKLLEVQPRESEERLNLDVIRPIDGLQNINERGLTEQRPGDSERRWRTLIDANVIGIVIADENRVIDANQRFFDMVGYSRDELIGDQRRVRLTPDEFAPLDLNAREQLATTGAVKPFEKEFRRKDGSRVSVLITGARLDESPLSWLGFVMDLTERKRAEEQIRENERRWRRLVESKLFGVVITNQEQVLDANQVYLDIIGYTIEELHDGKILRANLTPSEFKHLDERGLHQLRTTGSSMPYEKEYLRKDGTRVPVLLGSTTLTEDPLSWIGFIVDLTEQKRTQAALREGEEQLRALTRAAPAFLFTMRQNGECEYASEYYYEFTGKPAGSIAGRGWFDAFHPDDLERVGEAWRKSLAAGEPFEVEYRLRRSDGAYRWFKANAVKVRDQATMAAGWYGGSIDIHEQKEVQAALKEADRRKDEFLAMLAHELRNPLAAIVNALAIIERVAPPEPTADRARSVISRRVGHLTNMVDDLLDVTRITTGKIRLKKTQLSIASIVEQGVESAHPLLEARGHRLEISVPGEPITIEGDIVRLTQVLLNLLSNAAEYTPDGGTISLRAAREDGAAVIRVRDNGYGIAPELIPRVFDLFTHAAHISDRSQGGLGIGLTVVRHLVELHGGQVEALSEGIGHGSEFVVQLPLMETMPVESVQRSNEVAQILCADHSESRGNWRMR